MDELIKVRALRSLFFLNSVGTVDFSIRQVIIRLGSIGKGNGANAPTLNDLVSAGRGWKREGTRARQTG